jgi:hypothetical protein
MKKVLLALAAVLAFSLFPVTSASADGPSDEANFVSQINSLRATKGLPALAVDAGLTTKARAWAQTMADQNRIWHSSLADGITADWQRLGENVGMGGTVDALHIAFVNSPKHYDNLVDPAFRLVGIGVVRNAAGLIFVAEEFMLLQGPAVAAVAPVVAAAPVAAPAAVAAPVAPKAPVVAVKAVPAPLKAPASPPPPAPLVTAPVNAPIAEGTNLVRETRVPLGGSVGSQRWASAW